MFTKTGIKDAYRGVQGACPRRAVTHAGGTAERSERRAVGMGLKLVYFSSARVHSAGCGKTTVFVLATLQQLEPVNGEVSVLVLCDTQELAFQITDEYTRFAKYMPDVRVGAFYGGTPVTKDAEIFRDKTKCPHIVVATPGRLNALARDKVLDATNVKHFVLDGCDKMLEQLRLPHQSYFYSSLPSWLSASQ